MAAALACILVLPGFLCLAVGQLSAAQGADMRTQPVLLPMSDLLRALDRGTEWLFVPEADYRALVAAGQRAAPETTTAPSVREAWIEQLRIDAVLHQDRLLRLHASAVVVVPESPADAAAARSSAAATSTALGASSAVLVRRLRLFDQAPALLGEATLDGAPALFAQAAQGERLVLLLAKPGRNLLQLRWSIALDGDDRERRGLLHLPVSASLDLRLRSDTPGAFSCPDNGNTGHSGDRVIPDGRSASAAFTLIPGATPRDLDLRWHPGRTTHTAGAIYGVTEILEVTTAPGAEARSVVWTARCDLRRGDLPSELRLVLPPGMTLTEPRSGVIAVHESGTPHEVVLRRQPQATELSCAGLLDANAAIALPQLIGPDWQQGVIVLRGFRGEVSAPNGFVRLLPEHSDAAPAEYPVLRYGSVHADAARSGLRVLPLRSANHLRVQTSSHVAIGRERAELDQRIEIHPQAADVAPFALDLDLPPGFALLSLRAQARIDLPDAGPGSLRGRVRIGFPSGLTRSCELVLVASAALRADADDARLLHLQPALIPAAEAASHRLRVVLAPGLDLRVTDSADWRRDDDLPLHHDVPAALRLAAVGTPRALALTVRPGRAEVDVQAVSFVLPGLIAQGEAPWCRVDLRLAARGDDADAIDLDLPIPPAATRLLHGAFAIDRDHRGAGLRLRPAAPWQGERLVRLEGPLLLPVAGSASDAATGLYGPLPVLGVRLAGSATRAELRLRHYVGVQSAALLRLQPGRDAIAIDRDELPAFAVPLPGADLAAAYLLRDAPRDAGSFHLDVTPGLPGPLGFAAEVELHVALAPTGTRSLLRGLIAAPGIAALTVVLPHGETLLAATIDGQAAPLRSFPSASPSETTDAARVIIPLPGRTQVRLALLYEGPPPPALCHLRVPQLLAMPRLDATATLRALPIIRTRVELGVDSSLRLTVVDAGSNLHALMAPPQRAWFSTWQPGAVQRDAAELPPQRASDPPDARRLAAPALAHRADDRREPVLLLSGQRYRGESVGGLGGHSDDDGGLRVALTPLAELRAADRLGFVLAALLGLSLALAGWRIACLGGIAGLGCLCALTALDMQLGPLFSLCEWLLPAALAGLALRGAIALLRRAAGSSPHGAPHGAPPQAAPPAATAARGLILAALLSSAVSALSAATAPPVHPQLMGYAELDANGTPRDVRVALSREELTALWAAAQAASAAARSQQAHGSTMPCALATGRADYQFTLRDTGGAGELVLRLPVAVFAEDWQHLTVHCTPGSLVAARALPWGTQHPARIAIDRAALSSSTSASTLRLAIEGRRQALLELVFACAAERDGGLVFALPGLPGIGGTLTAALPRDLEPGDGLTAPEPLPGTASDPLLSWRGELPRGAAPLRLRVQHRDAKNPTAGALALLLHQDVICRLMPGHLDVATRLRVTIRAGELREQAFDLPPGLRLTAVSGEALAAWRQDGARLLLTWQRAQRSAVELDLRGLCPGDAPQAVLLSAAGVERSSGRIGLCHGAGRRFTRPDDARLARDDPRPGEDLAARYAEPPNGLLLASEPTSSELRLTATLRLIASPDRIRIAAAYRFSGTREPGAPGVDELRFALPEPWRYVPGSARLVTAATDRSSSHSGTSDVSAALGLASPQSPRTLLLRAPRPFAAIASEETLIFDLEADRRELVLHETTLLPEARPRAASWLREGAFANPRYQLDDAEDRLHVEASADGVRLRERSGSARGTFSASHVVAVRDHDLRWQAELIVTPVESDLARITCQLPVQAQLLRLRADDAAGFAVDAAGLLEIRLAAPTRTPIAVILDLALPFSAHSASSAHLTASGHPAASAAAAYRAGASATLAAIVPAMPGYLLAAETLAVIDADDGGDLLHVLPDGLAPLSDAGAQAGSEPACRLPLAIPADVVRARFAALRPDWQLLLRREALQRGGRDRGAGTDDRIATATTLDAVSVLTPQGELRTRATWQVHDRSTHGQHELRLAIPAGVELWEVAVDGRRIAPRLDAVDPPSAALSAERERIVRVPVTGQQSGSLSTRIALVWSQRIAAAPGLALRDGLVLRPHAPRFLDLRPAACLWRISAPAGVRCDVAPGALRPAAPGEAAADRARRLLDDLARLREDSVLRDAALRRSNAALEALALDLDDAAAHLEREQRMQTERPPLPSASPRPDPSGDAAAALDHVRSGQAQLRALRASNQALGSERARRQAALAAAFALDGAVDSASGSAPRAEDRAARALAWPPLPIPARQQHADLLPPLAPSATRARPWPTPTRSAPGQTRLDPGDPPPGRQGADHAAASLGLDLIGDPGPDHPHLILRGPGDLDAVLTLTSTAPSRWGWQLFGLLCAGVVLGLLAYARHVTRGR